MTSVEARKAKNSHKTVTEEDTIWLSELGHGHGLQKAAAMRRYSFFDQQQQLTARAFTAEDAQDVLRDNKAGRELSRISSISSIGSIKRDKTRSLQHITSLNSLSESIPIAATNTLTSEGSYYEEKLATSYNDVPRDYSKLVSGRHSIDHESDKSNESNNDNDEDDDCNSKEAGIDDAIFDFDETAEGDGSAVEKSHSQRVRSTSFKSNSNHHGMN